MRRRPRSRRAGTRRCEPLRRGDTRGRNIRLTEGGEHPLDGHLVACQGAGLIGADHRRRPERLDGVELLHNGVASGHPLYADCKHDRQDRGQALWRRSDGERDAKQQHHHQIARGADTIDEDDCQHDDNRDHGHDESKHLAEAVEFGLQGRWLFDSRIEHPGEHAHLGVHAGGSDDRAPHALGHRGSHKHHVEAVAR